MAKYTRFEDLPVWKAAAELAAQVFACTQHPFLRGRGDLANQLQRAALSISNNIAEGFERGTTQELLTFLYYARGSAGEVRSMLTILERMVAKSENQRTHRGAARDSGRSSPRAEAPDAKSEISNFKSEISNLKSSEISNFKSSEISNLKSEISDLKSLSESISRQLRAWADSLQNSEIKGQRHMTDASRSEYESRRRAESLDIKLKRIVAESQARNAQ